MGRRIKGKGRRRGKRQVKETKEGVEGDRKRQEKRGEDERTEGKVKGDGRRGKEWKGAVCY